MKITMGNKSSLIIHADAPEARKYDSTVKRISSTERQPYYGINFDGEKLVGGRTMSQTYVDILVATARKAGAKIEE